MNKSQFFDYIKRQLGAPLIHIEIDDRIKFSHGVVTNGPFIDKEFVTGSTSGATGTILNHGSNFVNIISISGAFELEEIVGSTSTATTTITEINTENSQMDDIVNTSMLKFQEFHYDALQEKFITLEIDPDITEYTLPNEVFSIIDIFGKNTSYLFNFDNDSIEDYAFEAYNGNFYSIYYDTVSLEVFRQNYEMLRASTKREYLFHYSFLDRKLIFTGDISRKETVVIWINSFLDDQDTAYSSYWFKEYCVALCGLMWAKNIGKYDGGMLPNGVSYNHEQIRQQYDEEKKELEEQLLDRYTDPLGVYVG